jgi:hypothetical protein
MSIFNAFQKIVVVWAILARGAEILGFDVQGFGSLVNR